MLIIFGLKLPLPFIFGRYLSRQLLLISAHCPALLVYVGFVYGLRHHATGKEVPRARWVVGVEGGCQFSVIEIIMAPFASSSSFR